VSSTKSTTLALYRVKYRCI